LGGFEMVSDDKINANFMKEWETARAVLSGFDTHLHDLRKYGFSLITVFLAADAIIFQTTIINLDLTNVIKLAVLGVTLLLIVTLLMIDRNYRVFQRAAATRAKIIERNLNLELTEVIAQRYDLRNLSGFITGIYLAFACGVLVLGLVAFTDIIYFFILLIVWVGAISAIFILNSRVLTLSFPYGMMDWTLDRLECNSGDEIKITLTNLDYDPLPTFPTGTVMWEIMKEEETSPVKIQRIKKPITLQEKGNYVWLWKTDEDLENGKKTLETGIYRFLRLTTNKKTGNFELKPLKKRLRITKASEDKPSVHKVFLKKEGTEKI
jgi:hypothetical protein